MLNVERGNAGLCRGKGWKLRAEAETGLLHLRGWKTNRTVWIWPCVKIQSKRAWNIFPWTSYNPMIKTVQTSELWVSRLITVIGQSDDQVAFWYLPPRPLSCRSSTECSRLMASELKYIVTFSCSSRKWDIKWKVLNREHTKKKWSTILSLEFNAPCCLPCHTDNWWLA